jgi:hypothetical protein
VPFVTEKVQMFTYWNNFFDWLEKRGGLSLIRHWCDLQMLPGGVGYFQRGEIAPGSEAKDNVVKDGYSPGMRLLYDVAREIKEDNPDRLVAITDRQAQSVLKQFLYNGQEVKYLEKPSTIRKVFETAGWHIAGELIKNRDWNGVKCRDHRVMLTGPDAQAYVSCQVGTIMSAAPELYDLLSLLKRREEF